MERKSFLSLIREEDHVVAQRSHYMGTTQLTSEVLQRFGVDVTVVDQTDECAIEAAVRSQTRLIIVDLRLEDCSRLMM